MHVLTVAWDQLMNINYAFLNSAKWKILEFQGSRVGIYYVSLFLKFLQINNNIRYLLVVQKQITFRLKFLCASHMKIKYSELLPCLQNWTYENKIDWDAHLMSYISRWLLLVSVILQISNLKAISIRDIFFDTPCISKDFNGLEFLFLSSIRTFKGIYFL